MADISKINAVALADIAKLDAVLAANIAKVNGLVFTTAPAFTGLLDTYTGAAAGYSTRRLASSATNLMRIREASGDTETDIGYDSNGDLDVAAIASHCGTADGFVVSWIDQSGNGNDADQSTNGSQPKIYDGTTQAVITENGKPIIKQVNGSSGLVTALAGNSTAWVFSALDIHAASTLLSDNGTLEYFLTAQSGNSVTHINGITSSNIYKNGSSVTYTTQDTVWQSLNQNQSLISAELNTSGVAAYLLGLSNTSWGCYDMQEVILWHSDQSSNRTGIESNINSEYLIYQPTDAPTSGLLATYTGAAAAYSVRQLSDKAVIAMRIRRDSDDEETNIGWDANGDLDTTAISDFCGTANGYVTRWADQSTEGNHADQATDTKQPQIYNGTAVITENGKPVIKAQTGTVKLTTTLSTGVTDQTIFSVNRLDRTGVFWGANDSSSAFFLAAESGSGSSSIISGFTNVEMRKNGSTYSFTSKTRGNLFTDFQSQHLMTVEFDIGSSGTYQQLGYWTSPDTTFAMWSTQEVIIYASANKPSASDRTGIETNINTYFSIYT